MRRIVLVGDKTDHGGVVITGSSSFTSNGSRVAMIGDMVSCPVRHHGVTPILPDSPRTAKSNGRLFALEGDLCGCGGKIIASGRFKSP
jgi:uncharacterized Zn-binding protein involved in type VI secretion